MKNIRRKKTIKNMIFSILAVLFVLFLGLKKSMFLFVGVLAINVILFVHELGHFLAAKAVKMPVHEFSVGIGPKFYSKTIKEVEYCIRYIPLGGYVILEKNIDDENCKEEAVDSYRSTNPFKRILVVLAGPFFNFLLAFIIVTGLLIHGGFETTTIGSLVKNSAAQEYGLQVGDSILSINNVDIKSWEDIVSITSKNEDLSFKINRDGKIETIDVKAKLDEKSNVYKVGISPKYEKDTFKSIYMGANATIHNIKTTVDGYVGMVKDVFVKNKDTNVELVGPVGTIQTISESASYGATYLLVMVFSMSISVGVFNLIPLIPNLDGGRLLFIFVEILRGGKQLNKKVEENILLTGAFVIMMLFLFITAKDLISLF